MKLFAFTLFVFVFLSSAILLGQNVPSAPDTKSLIEQKCLACHSMMKITGKKRSPEDWTTIMKRMRILMDKKGKEKLNDSEESEITAYLIKEYGK